MNSCSVDDCDRGIYSRIDDVPFCNGHVKQMRRYGVTTSLRCVQHCGNDRDGRSQLCGGCRNDLLSNGLGRCNVHGVRPLASFNKAGKCKECRADWMVATGRVGTPCMNGCGSTRLGGGCALCRECFDDLATRGLGHCKVHGVQPLVKFDPNSKQCRACAAVSYAQSRRSARTALLEPWLKSQSHQCAICCGALTLTSARIDHDHAHDCKSKSGCPDCRRSLLCNRCNSLLGAMYEDPVIARRVIGKSERYEDDVLLAAARYLERWHKEMHQRDVRISGMNPLDCLLGELGHLIANDPAPLEVWRLAA